MTEAQIDLEQEIAKQLASSYIAAGRSVSTENVVSVAHSMVESIDFTSTEEIREAFRRARNVADIPTQRVLREALDNARQERTVARIYAPENVIDYMDPREPWLPKDDVRKRINLNEAVKNYCIAMGGNMYAELCRVSVTTKDSDGSRRFVNPQAQRNFVRPIWDKLKTLYSRYWRYLPQNAGYPNEAGLDIRLTPPRVDQFRKIFRSEGMAFNA